MFIIYTYKSNGFLIELKLFEASYIDYLLIVKIVNREIMMHKGLSIVINNKNSFYLYQYHSLGKRERGIVISSICLPSM